MRTIAEFLVHSVLLLATLNVAGGIAVGATPYIITNDDAGFPFTGVSFLAVGPNGGLALRQQVATVGTGIGGGFFGANRIRVLSNSPQNCVFASEAGTHTVLGINIYTLAGRGSAPGADTDDSSGNGNGLDLNDPNLYASLVQSK